MSELVLDAAERSMRGRRGSRRLPVLIALCFLFIVAIAVCALFGALISPHDAASQDLLNTLKGPSGSHLFGTDALGQDVFSRTIVGARTAVVGPLVIAIGAMVVGNALGTLAGYRGGALDFAIMRWADLMYSLPSLVVAIVVVANTFLNFAFSLVALSGLSYLGLGVSPGTADWGRMIADNRNLLFQNPLAALGPAAALVLTATAVNLLGDWMYERLADRGRAR